MENAIPKKTRAPLGLASARRTPTVRLLLSRMTSDRLRSMAAADGASRSSLVTLLIDDEWERREFDRAAEARIAEVRARNKRR